MLGIYVDMVNLNGFQKIIGNSNTIPLKLQTSPDTNKKTLQNSHRRIEQKQQHQEHKI